MTPSSLQGGTSKFSALGFSPGYKFVLLVGFSTNVRLVVVSEWRRQRDEQRGRKSELRKHWRGERSERHGVPALSGGWQDWSAMQCRGVGAVCVCVSALAGLSPSTFTGQLFRDDNGQR